MKHQSYRDLKAQLDEVLVKLQAEDIDIDEAIKLHDQGQELIKQLEVYLGSVSDKISKATDTK